MDEKSLQAGFSEALQKANALDILVNNGLEGLGKDLTSVTFEEFSRHQRNNAGYFELARLLHDHVVARVAPGSVINIGSMYGQVGLCESSGPEMSVHLTPSLTRHTM